MQKNYAAQYPGIFDGSWAPALVSAAEDVTGNLRPAFLTLLAAVAAVLLIACSNVANLLLVRFTARRREIALRAALGASRSGLVRLFIFESTILSLTAGALGLLLASWMIAAAPKLAGNNVPLEPNLTLHWPVFLFTLALSLGTGLAMGLYPAWQSSRTELANELKDGGRAMSGSRGQQRVRRGLVAAQVALSVLLLAGAALLLASFNRLSHEKIGFRPEGIWIGGIGLPAAHYGDDRSQARFVERLRDRTTRHAGRRIGRDHGFGSAERRCVAHPVRAAGYGASAIGTTPDCRDARRLGRLPPHLWHSAVGGSRYRTNGRCSIIRRWF